MKIKIVYFASLREQIGREGDQVEIISAKEVQVIDVWKQATGMNELSGNLLIAVNQEYTSQNTLLKDGDEVAFFPPVTGG